MIVAVALNPALDLTYRLDGPLVSGTTHRVAAVEKRPGGKALNVARVLQRLGAGARIVAPLGGRTGEEIAAAVDGLSLDATWVPIAGETRRTVVAWDPSTGTATTLSEPGPLVSAAEWQAIVSAVTDLLPAETLVVAGSSARGIPDRGIGELAAIGRRSGTPVIVDTSTPAALHAAIDAAATLVKPNRDELTELVGHALDDSIESLAEAADELRAGREVAVVASDGPRGLVAVTSAGRWRARPPRIAGANATGAGDACVAGLATGLAGGTSWPERLRLAAALGAAAARQPVAGEIGSWDDLYARTAVEEL